MEHEMDKIEIRPYTSEDWSMVLSWWKDSGECPPFETMMPLDSSFIATIAGEPALAVCLYLTNTPDVAYIENFIGNPKLKGPARQQATAIIVSFLSKFAHGLGYKRLLCLSEKPVLKTHYEKMGFTRTLDGLASFIKETKSCQQQ